MNFENVKNTLRRACKFGPYLAFSNLLPVYGRKFLSHKRLLAISKKRNDLIQKRIRSFVTEQKCEDIPVPEVRKENVIWVCWLQGYEAMPEISRICFESLRENVNGHEVILLTLENYSSYVSLPDIVEELYRTKRIKPAHFADLLRINILAQQGGLWVDATMLFTDPIGEEWFSYPFYTIKSSEKGYFVSKCRWAVFMLGCHRGNKLFVRVAKAFEAYFKQTDLFIDYFLFDHFIDILYQTDSEVRKMIDDVPLNNPEVHALNNILCQSFDAHLFGHISERTSMFKLSTRSYGEEDLNRSRSSYYQYFKQLYLK